MQLKYVVSMLGLTAAVSTLTFFLGKHSVIIPDQIHYTDYEGYKDLISNEEDFVLYIGRSSCKICAIVTGSIHKFADHEADVYVLNLEDVRGTDAYDEIKNDIGFYYMPCFKAYDDGVEIAHMNNPLDDSYFDEGADYAALLSEMELRITEFLDGAVGKGPLIDEEPMSGTIVATPVEKGE